MNSQLKYSVCATVYNSAQIIEEAIDPLLNLDENFEIVIVDNYSIDGTFEKLKNYEPRIKLYQRKCSRGLGKQVAIQLSTGKIIILISDFDVSYTNIANLVDIHEKCYIDKVSTFIPDSKGCNAVLYIGKRDLFFKIQGFPDLNNSDDLYFNRIAESLGLLIKVPGEMLYKCLELRNLTSGQESRYESKKIKKFTRRVYSTRDILFVKELNFQALMEWYHLRGSKKLIYGLPLYVLGKILELRIKVPKTQTKIKEIKESEIIESE